jgi:hypothetical protein
MEVNTLEKAAFLAANFKIAILKLQKWSMHDVLVQIF